MPVDTPRFLVGPCLRTHGPEHPSCKKNLGPWTAGFQPISYDMRKKNETPVLSCRSTRSPHAVQLLSVHALDDVRSCLAGPGSSSFSTWEPRWVREFKRVKHIQYVCVIEMHM